MDGFNSGFKRFSAYALLHPLMLSTVSRENDKYVFRSCNVYPNIWNLSLSLSLSLSDFFFNLLQHYDSFSWILNKNSMILKTISKNTVGYNSNKHITIIQTKQFCMFVDAQIRRKKTKRSHFFLSFFLYLFISTNDLKEFKSTKSRLF